MVCVMPLEIKNRRRLDERYSLALLLRSIEGYRPRRLKTFSMMAIMRSGASALRVIGTVNAHLVPASKRVIKYLYPS